MTTIDENEQEHNATLLSDEEFAELALNDYADSQKRVDPLMQKRIWQRLEATTLSKKLSWQTKAISALAACLLLSIIAIRFTMDDELRIKGDKAPHSPLTLTAYILTEDDELLALEHHQPNEGDTIIFKAQTTQEIYATLIRFDANRETEQVVEPMLLSPGGEWALGDADDVFAYTMPSGTSDVKYCLIGALSKKALADAATDLSRGAHQIQNMNCISLSRQN